MFTESVLCRAALYPKFVTPAGLFDDEMLLQLHPDKATGTYSLSVACEFIANRRGGVHLYGEKAAELANTRFARVKGRAPEPTVEEVHYLGFYRFRYRDVLELPLEHYSSDCKWKPENGLDMHFQIDFTPLETDGTKSQRRDDRRAAIGVLATRLYGPERHISARDEPYRNILEAVDLPTKTRSKD